MSKGGDPIASLRSLFKDLIVLSLEKEILLEFHMLKFVHIASYPSIVHLHLLHLPVGSAVGSNKISHELSLLWAEQTLLLQPLLAHQVLQPSNQLGVCWTYSFIAVPGKPQAGHRSTDVVFLAHNRETVPWTCWLHPC